MFSLHMERSRSDSSASSDTNSSTLSLSPSGWNPAGATLSPPTTTTTPFGSVLDWQHIPKPTRTRSTGLMPKRARSGPGSCASAPEYTYETFCPSSGQSSYAYPHWPSGDSLSTSPADGGASSGPRSVPSNGLAYAPPSSRISDDDLADVNFAIERADCPQPPSSLETVAEVPVGRPSLADGGISWSQVGTGAPLPQSANAEQQQTQPQRRRRLPPPPAGYVMHRDGSNQSRRSKRNASSSPRKHADSAIC